MQGEPVQVMQGCHVPAVGSAVGGRSEQLCGIPGNRDRGHTAEAEYVEPTVADGYAARHLGIRLRTPLFQIERTTYTVAGVIAEYRRGVLRGDIYRYRIELR